MTLSGFILFIILQSLFINSNETKVRSKRVVRGHEASDDHHDSYPVFKYYVYLAKTSYGEIDEDPSKISDFRSWIAKFLHYHEGASLDFMDCGGSLITPIVIQTACHCLAIFEDFSPHDNYTYAYPLNVWEDRIYSYLGSNEARKMHDFLVPKHYVISQNCKVFEFDLDFPVMDIGFIVAKDPVTKRAPRAAISYAPVYRAKDILQFYYSSIQKEYTCLIVGHGSWRVESSSEETIVADEASELQRWGWRTLMNYIDCLSASYPKEARKRREGIPFVFFNYTSDSTQACLKAISSSRRSGPSLTPHDYNIGSGDSGGPVTCNNVLFALSSMAEEQGSNIISYVTPIVHGMFMHALEYRDDFISWCTEFFINPDLSIYTDPDRPYVIPTYPEYNPTPPDIDFGPLSKSSTICVYHYFTTFALGLFYLKMLSM